MNCTDEAETKEVFAKIRMAYEEKAGMSDEQSAHAATGYLDAVDDIMEGVYYMLRTIGPLEANIWTTKKGHEIAGKLWAGN